MTLKFYKNIRECFPHNVEYYDIFTRSYEKQFLKIVFG